VLTQLRWCLLGLLLVEARLIGLAVRLHRGCLVEAGLPYLAALRRLVLIGLVLIGLVLAGLPLAALALVVLP
jgi:hypothetical protein